MTNRLAAVLLERIARRGPMPFEAFMRAALYEPGLGFFARGVVRSSRTGDFLTSPEVSPMFGETLAAFVEAEAQRLAPDRPSIVDVGAGSGSLLRPLVGAIADLAGTYAVEASPAAREALVRLLGEGRVFGALDEVPVSGPAVVIANELLDNLPVALAVRSVDGWEERWVGEEEGRLVLVAAPVRAEVLAWLTAHAGPLPEGSIVEVQIVAGEWIAAAMAKAGGGTVVVFDYGDTFEGLAPRRAAGTLRTYRAHHLGPPPLDHPGEVDITVDVDFSALERVVARLGGTSELERQEEFLTRWGLRDRLTALRRRELELARDGDPMERLEVRSRRTEAETLLHPRGLGDFRVLIVRPGDPEEADLPA